MDAFFTWILLAERRYAREFRKGETGSKGSHFLIIRSDKGELGKFVVSNWGTSRAQEMTHVKISLFSLGN